MARTSFDLSRRFQREAALSQTDLATISSRLMGNHDRSPMSRDDALDLIGRIQATTAAARAVISLLVNAQDHGADEPVPELSDDAQTVIDEIHLALDAFGVRSPAPVEPAT